MKGLLTFRLPSRWSGIWSLELKHTNLGWPQPPLTNNRVCFHGGAAGTDAEWSAGSAGRSAGHTVGCVASVSVSFVLPNVSADVLGQETVENSHVL